MKRRGFFRCVLALLGLKAVGARLFPAKAQFVSELVIGEMPPGEFVFVDLNPNSPIRYVVNAKTGVYEIWKEPNIGKVTLTENPEWVTSSCELTG